MRLRWRSTTTSKAPGAASSARCAARTTRRLAVRSRPVGVQPVGPRPDERLSPSVTESGVVSGTVTVRHQNGTTYVRAKPSNARRAGPQHNLGAYQRGLSVSDLSGGEAAVRPRVVRDPSGAAQRRREPACQRTEDRRAAPAAPWCRVALGEAGGGDRLLGADAPTGRRAPGAAMLVAGGAGGARDRAVNDDETFERALYVSSIVWRAQAQSGACPPRCSSPGVATTSGYGWRSGSVAVARCAPSASTTRSRPGSASACGEASRKVVGAEGSRTTASRRP